MTTTTQYIEDLEVLVASGIPIIITKTREPKQVLRAVEVFTLNGNSKIIDKARVNESMDSRPALLNFGTWDVLDGWAIRTVEYFEQKIAGEVVKVPEGSKISDIGAGFDYLLDAETGHGIYCMSWTHFFMDSPYTRSYLHEIAHRFIHERKRLILIVPEVIEIPMEIQDFVSFLNFDVPSEKERFDIIRHTYESHSMNPALIKPEELQVISAAGAGMTGFELGNSISRALTVIKKHGTKDDVNGEKVAGYVTVNKSEMVERSEVLEVMPQGNMEEIGGLENLKDWIYGRKPCFSQEAIDFGVDRPKGVALGGPPGTGKSACAKATGHALGLPVIKFEFARIFGSLVGQSEQRAKATLKLIESMAPCVVLLDEVDKIFDVNAGSGDSGVGKRVLGMILTFMQESPAHVFWMFTFNRAEGLPPELLRKGRMDEVFSVGAPNEKEREQILKIHLKKRKQNPDLMDDLNVAVQSSDGYVPAELEAAIKEALVVAFNTKVQVTGQLIADQFANMRALSEAFPEQFESMARWARENARPASAQSVQTSGRKRKTISKPGLLGEPGRKVIGDDFL